MTTFADWIAETEAFVLGARRDERNRLSAAITTTTATSVTFVNALNGIQAGAVISVDLEEMYVEAVTSSGGTYTATVVRGDNGSVAATHLINSVVYVNPQSSKFRIARALNNDLRSLASPRNGLFKVNYVDLTFSASKRGYDLASVTNMMGDPLRVLAQDSDTTGADWIEILKYRFYNLMPTTSFASGRSLMLDQPGDPGRTIRVVYRSTFTELANLADDVSTTGLQATAYDLPPLGAAIEILSARPGERSSMRQQGEPRRATEMTVNDAINSPVPLSRLRAARIAEEAAHLISDYPTRVHR